MMNTRGIARLGLLAVGLCIGAAVASTPGVASADSSSDWLSSIDRLLGGLSVPAADPAQALDMQISIDGMDLFPTAGNTAYAHSEMGDIAIAIGNGSQAAASVGTHNFAFADGAQSAAKAAFGNNDSSIVVGTNSSAEASDGSNDFASAFGNGNHVLAGGGSNDFAAVIGPNSESSALFGNGDLAFIVNTGNAGIPSDDDLAQAGSTSPNFLGSSDIAAVVGTDDSAVAGAHPPTLGNFDLAAVVFGDMLNANASGGNFLVDILPKSLDTLLSSFETLASSL